MTLIKTLFAHDIYRRIEEVIKVDQTDEAIIREEITEYVATDAIKHQFGRILDRYQETPNKPHEGIAVWVSGFFGSGKSSFAKMLGLTIANQPVLGDPAAALFTERVGDKRIQVLLNSINEHIPTHVVIFDVSTDRGIRSGNQTLTEITYKLFLQSLGYAKDLDLAELEIALESEGRLDAFKTAYRQIFDKDWDVEKGKLAFALNQASRVMNTLEPETFPQADSWVKGSKDRADITPGLLAERTLALMKRRLPGHSLMFVVDEVGQFVARDVQKMLDLQAIVQSLGRVGQGKQWLIVTSQEKLTELVGGLDDRRVELARLMDRFPQELQVHLEPSDISEVTSRRVLAKNAAAQNALRELFETYRGRLTQNTRVTADIQLPELSTERFIDLYPLLPYQVDFIIQVVSGLRTQGGASRHVGGANRTIIKLAQQLLISPSVSLAERPVGSLVRIDEIYDLVEGNIASDVRAKIASIPQEVPHPLAPAVAKAICLLQFVKSIHRTAENIAAVLHPAVDADSCLPSVREALDALVAALKIRLGDDGYRIPSPAEDDWERQRNSLTPNPGSTSRLQAEVLATFWQPQPSCNLLDTKVFKAGMSISGREIASGDMSVHFYLAEAGAPFAELAAETRTRSQQEKKSIFWCVPIDEAIDRETVALYRSKEMLSRKEREARTGDESALIAEERARANRHQDELKRRLKQACLSGSVFFRGNDRSPGDRATDVGKTAAEILGQALPEVFERFKEAAAKVQKKDLDALLTSENLMGLTPVFSNLNLVRSEKGKPVFALESGPLAEVMSRIENRANYGETANGRYIADEFAKDPYGWDFDVVRLFVLALLRAGKIEVTSKGQTFDSAPSVDAKETFDSNNLFKQAAFRPKVGLEFEHVVQAADHYQSVFGQEIKELTSGTVASAIRESVTRKAEDMQEVLNKLIANALPGASVIEGALEQAKTIRMGNESNAILTFNSSWSTLKEAIKRASELDQALTAPNLADLARAKKVMTGPWPFLETERDLDDGLRAKAATLEDLLQRETFFKELPAIDQHAKALAAEFDRRYEDALQARAAAYEKAYQQLTSMPEWQELDENHHPAVTEPITSRMGTTPKTSIPIPQLRSDLVACQSRLAKAKQKVLEIIDGDRLVALDVSPYFGGRIETEDQLDAAVKGLQAECARLIGSGKKVLLKLGE